MVTFLERANNLYSKTHPEDLAKTLLKSETNIGSVVVSILDHTGIAGFKFHVPEREQVEMQSNVTNHYVENGSCVQDHITLEPVRITLNGFQGDFFYPVQKIENLISKITPTMNLVAEFTPAVANIVKQVKAVKADYLSNLSDSHIPTSLSSDSLQQSLDTFTSSLGSATTDITSNSAIAAAADKYIKSKPGKLSALRRAIGSQANALDLFTNFQDLYKLKSAQTRAFMFLEALMVMEVPFSVETTWKRYDNMIMTSLKPLRDNNADITDFTVTFQQVRFASTLTQKVENSAGRVKQQLSEVANKGIDKGKQVDAIAKKAPETIDLGWGEEKVMSYAEMQNAEIDAMFGKG